MADRQDQFILGLLNAITKLTGGAVHVCKAPECGDPRQPQWTEFRWTEFAGPHPAGLVGHTFTSSIRSVRHKTVWYVELPGRDCDRRTSDNRQIGCATHDFVSPARSSKSRDCLRPAIGASIDELVAGELTVTTTFERFPVPFSPVEPPPAHHAFLGRYHTQISVLEEGNEREFLGWQKPGFDKFSTTRVFASSMFPIKSSPSRRAPAEASGPWFRSGLTKRSCHWTSYRLSCCGHLIVKDTDQAQQLGALELEEEDLALCTFVCPGKVRIRLTPSREPDHD